MNFILKTIQLIVVSISAILLTSCAPPELSIDQLALPPADPLEQLASSPDTEVRLTGGDLLSVNVWGQDDLSKQVTLDTDGYIYYPFIGKVHASGLTIEQLQIALTKKLSQYYVDPQITVTPFKLAGQTYSIIGEVGTPGNFEINKRETVLEVIAAAGGPSQDAGDYIVLLRKKNNKLLLFSIPVQFSKLSEKSTASITMLVQANDILYLPPGNFANTERFMERINNILNPLLALERGILYWPALVDAIEGSSGDVLLPIQ